MFCSRYSRFWILYIIAVGAGLVFISAPSLVAAPGKVSSGSGAELADTGSIELYNVHINPDGTAGSVDYGWSVAPVTILFDGLLGKVAFDVYAHLTPSGVAGAEFYLEGLEALPDGWTKTVLPAPGLFVMGDWSDPIGGIRRVLLTWTVDGPEDVDCQHALGVFLCRVELTSPFGNPALPPTEVRVVAGNPPSNPAFPCPKLIRCNSPIFTEVCANGGTFRIGSTLPEIVNPFPADGAEGVQPDVVLSWQTMGPTIPCPGIGTPSTSVYFGTSADPPHTFNDDTVYFTFDPPDLLAPNTTYYWRIATTPDHDCGVASSPVWSFTTVDPISVESATWATVKRLFRE